MFAHYDNFTLKNADFTFMRRTRVICINAKLYFVIRMDRAITVIYILRLKRSA